MLGGLKRFRHRWQHAKLSQRARRSARRAGKRVREAVSRATYRGRKGTLAALRGARQLAYYRAPGERSHCPACGSPRLRLLQPISYSQPLAYGWRFGFLSGCETCGLLFANPLPSDAELGHMYSPGGDWGRTRQDEAEERVSRDRLRMYFGAIGSQLDVLRPPRGAAVLDFGCGLGGMLDSLADLGWTTHGIETAMKTAFDRHTEVTEIPSTPTYDLVVLHHVLEHVTDPLVILRRLAAATKPGGFVLIKLPNLDGVGEHGELDYCIRSKTHVMAYSHRCLEWLTASAGYRIVATPVGGGERQQAVVARRESAPVPVPDDPLVSAREALRRYYASHPGETHALRRLPIRLQAALLNLQHAWHRPGRSAVGGRARRSRG